MTEKKGSSFVRHLRLAAGAFFAAAAATMLAITMTPMSHTSIAGANSPAHTQSVSSQAKTTASDPAKGTVITLPNDKSVTLPKNWSQMSIADLAKLGLHPDMRPSKALIKKLGARIPATDIPHATATKSSGARLDSASGCNGWVCIYLTGSGWVIDSWETTASDSDATCTYAAYWLYGSIYTTSNEVCSGSYSVYDSWLGYGISTLGNTYACNTWVTIAGKPCEYVHN